jgi:4-carboxymuconolactone decarboxylase
MAKHDARMKRGMKVLKKMGRDKLMLDQKTAYPALYDLSVGHLFGDIWSRPHLSLRERQLITLASNVALARPTGNHSHYHSALHIGIKKEAIMELIIQVGAYAGWPVMGLALRQFNKVLSVAGTAKKRKVKDMEEISASWER